MVDPTTRILDERIDAALAKRGGGGHPPDMIERVVRLEEWAKQSDSRMERIEGKLDRTNDLLGEVRTVLAGMATKRDLANYTFAGLGIGLALMALIIGGIIGGLSWVKPDVPVVAPVGSVVVPAPNKGSIIVTPPASSQH